MHGREDATPAFFRKQKKRFPTAVRKRHKRNNQGKRRKTPAISAWRSPEFSPGWWLPPPHSITSYIPISCAAGIMRMQKPVALTWDAQGKGEGILLDKRVALLMRKSCSRYGSTHSPVWLRGGIAAMPNIPSPNATSVNPYKYIRIFRSCKDKVLYVPEVGASKGYSAVTKAWKL